MGVSSTSLRDQQVGIGAAVRAAHAAAQLVELGEPEAVGAVDQNRVAQRDVEAVLDDGRGHQNVGFVMHELAASLFRARLPPSGRGRR